MALSRTSSSNPDLPADAVLLSEDEALAFQWKIVKNWDKISETWALRYTPTIIGSLSAVTGIFVNSHYRSRLRLGNYGKLSTYLPIVVVPAIFSVLSHKFAVQRNILLDPMGKCPVCMQTRAAALQTGCGVIYPTLLAPMASFMFATRHYTYRLPSITEKPKEVLQLWRKMTRPILPIMSLIFFGQTVIAMYLTGKQIEQNLNLQIKMNQFEREAEEKYREAQIRKQALTY